MTDCEHPMVMDISTLSQPYRTLMCADCGTQWTEPYSADSR